MKSIAFKTDMVSAILDGKKTVTRRVIMPANTWKASPEGWKQNVYGLWIDPDTDNGDRTGHVKDYSISPMWQTIPHYTEKYAPCKKGEIVYVREKFCVGAIGYGEESDGRCLPYVSQCIGETNTIPYEYCLRNDIGIDDVIWKPSLHMSEKQARIFLEVTDVYIERLQDISAEGMKEEGLSVTDIKEPVKAFSELWDSTVSKKNRPYYTWDKNPFVWVISFRMLPCGANNPRR